MKSLTLSLSLSLFLLLPFIGNWAQVATPDEDAIKMGKYGNWNEYRNAHWMNNGHSWTFLAICPKTYFALEDTVTIVCKIHGEADCISTHHASWMHSVRGFFSGEARELSLYEKSPACSQSDFLCGTKQSKDQPRIKRSMILMLSFKNLNFLGMWCLAESKHLIVITFYHGPFYQFYFLSRLETMTDLLGEHQSSNSSSREERPPSA